MSISEFSLFDEPPKPENKINDNKLHTKQKLNFDNISDVAARELDVSNVFSKVRLENLMNSTSFKTIDELIIKHRNSDEKESSPDFLNIDIDGNDWYVWDAIKSVRPRLVCIEYNGKFPPDLNWKQAYNCRHIWDYTDWQGASLKAMELLGREKGYVLVGTNLTGANAFFVRDDLYSRESFLSRVTAEELYNPYRKSVLSFAAPGHEARYGLVGQEENKGVLNYFASEAEYKRARNKEKMNKLKKRIKKAFRGN